MKQNFRNLEKFYQTNPKLIQIILLTVVFILTFILRSHNYEKTPGIGHLEEQMFGWAGIYLIEEGVPVSWSSLDYPSQAEVYRGEINYQGGDPKVHVRLFRPWLEQPPLYSLLSGGVAHLMGASRHQVLPNAYIRIPAVLFAALTSLMIFLVARQLSSFWISLLAMGLYGTIPIFVIGSRLSVPENLIALFLLIMVYLLLKYQQSQRWIFVIWLPILAGLAGLAKPTGYFLMPLAAFYMLKYRRWNHLMYVLLGLVPFIAIYILYGTHFDSQIFWFIQARQSGRPAGFADLAWFFISPAYDIFSFIDTWYIFCLLSAGFFLFKPPTDSKRIVAFALFYWLIIVMISGGETDLLPWYRYPAFPLLAIAGAWGIEFLWQRVSFFSSLAFVSFFLGNRLLLANAFRDNIQPTQFRLLFSGLMLPSVLQEVWQKKNLLLLTKIIMVGVFVVGMFWNITFIYNSFELNCESKTCPTGPTTILSRLYFPVFYRFLVLGQPDRH